MTEKKSVLDKAEEWAAELREFRDESDDAAQAHFASHAAAHLDDLLKAVEAARNRDAVAAEAEEAAAPTPEPEPEPAPKPAPKASAPEPKAPTKTTGKK